MVLLVRWTDSPCAYDRDDCVEEGKCHCKPRVMERVFLASDVRKRGNIERGLLLLLADLLQLRLAARAWNYW
jgi:hypothetical protein